MIRPVAGRIAALKQQLQILRIDRQRLIVSVADQFPVTDILRPRFHAVRERDVVDSCKRLQIRIQLRDGRPLAVQAIGGIPR